MRFYEAVDIAFYTAWTAKFPQLTANISINLNHKEDLTWQLTSFFSFFKLLESFLGNVTGAITNYDVPSANWMKVSELSVFLIPNSWSSSNYTKTINFSICFWQKFRKLPLMFSFYLRKQHIQFSLQVCLCVIYSDCTRVEEDWELLVISVP